MRQTDMSYYFSTVISATFDQAIERARAALAEEGFGVLTDIDVSATLKAKIGVDFKPYRILGACNPALAYRALQREDRIGTMLPCNLIVQQRGPDLVEIAAVDPVRRCRQSPIPDSRRSHRMSGESFARLSPAWLLRRAEFEVVRPVPACLAVRDHRDALLRICPYSSAVPGRP